MVQSLQPVISQFISHSNSLLLITMNTKAANNQYPKGLQSSGVLRSVDW